MPYQPYDPDEPDEVEIACGWTRVTSVLGGVTITYTEGFEFIPCNSDSLSCGTEGPERAWTLEGARIAGEDDEAVDVQDFDEMLRAHNFEVIDYRFLEPEFNQTADIDIDEDSTMDTITIKNDNAPDLRFTGERVASTSSSANSGGQAGRWSELVLYKTVGGKFVCEQIGRTRWQGEHDRHSGAVCDDAAGVIAFFGHGWLAKELYDEADIEDVVEVD